MKGGRRKNYSRGDGAQTAPHPCPDRQFDRRKHRYLTRSTQTHESHGHAVLLAPRSGREPKTIPFLLAAGHAAVRRLLDKAPFPLPSSSDEKRNTYPIQGGVGLEGEDAEK